MLCLNCHADCMADDMYCHRCGTDLTLRSKALCQLNRIFRCYYKIHNYRVWLLALALLLLE